MLFGCMTRRASIELNTRREASTGSTSVGMLPRKYAYMQRLCLVRRQLSSRSGRLRSRCPASTTLYVSQFVLLLLKACVSLQTLSDVNAIGIFDRDKKPATMVICIGQGSLQLIGFGGGGDSDRSAMQLAALITAASCGACYTYMEGAHTFISNAQLLFTLLYIQHGSPC